MASKKSYIWLYILKEIAFGFWIVLDFLKKEFMQAIFICNTHFKNVFVIKNFIEVWLFYNVVLVSGVYLSESINTFTHSFLDFFPV